MMKTDVVIAGGGLAGASLALLLCHHTQLSVTLVEAATLPPPSDAPLTPSFNARSTALSEGSLRIYQQLGLFDELLAEAAQITEVDVSTRGYLGRTRLTAKEVQAEQLGAVVENRWLGRLLLAEVHRQERIQLLSPHRLVALERQAAGYGVTLDDQRQIDCRLLVVADGARSHTRELLGIAAHHEDTGEAALVVNVGLAQDCPHQGIAYERFLDSGPLALLPLADERMTLVWTGKQSLVDELMALPEDAFLARVQEQASLLKVQVASVGERGSYPMVLTQTAAQAIPYAVVVGNAAHTLHPVAAQGFNLTLRDLDCLARTLKDAEHPGQLSLLEQYVQARQLDQAVIKRTSGWLPDLFRVAFPPVAHGRQLGLMAMSVLPSLRRAFTRRAMGAGH